MKCSFVDVSVAIPNGEGNGNPLQYSCLENSMDRGAWWSVVHGVAKSWTRLSDFTFTFHFHALEKKMATHSNILAWRIPGMEEPGGLPSMGWHRVRHDWRDSSSRALIELRDYYYFFHVWDATNVIKSKVRKCYLSWPLPMYEGWNDQFKGKA